MDSTPSGLATASPPLNRRVLMAGGTVFLLTAIPARGALAQAGTPASPTVSDAEALLTEAATAMTELDTFAFSLVTVEGETTILEGFTLEEVSGVVRRPTDFQTTVTVEIPFASLDLTAVSVDNEVWIELPTLGEGEGGWTSLGSSNELVSLLNPDVLILEAVPYIDDPAIVDTGDIDGVPVTYVSGSVDFRAIADRLAADQAELANQLAEGPAALMIAIDDDTLIREIEITGPLLATEAEDVVRLVTFSAFNEPVEIETPQV